MKQLLIAIVVLALAGFAWFAWHDLTEPEPEPDLPVATIAPKPLDEPAEPPFDPWTVEDEDAADLTQSESDAMDEPVEILPELVESDEAMRELASNLVGAAAVTQYLVTDDLISRLVATTDSLTGRQVPAMLLPLNPPDSELEVTEDTDPENPVLTPEGDVMRQYILDPVNQQRYTPYVELIESLDGAAVAAEYRRYEPLFQQAFEELGYPDADYTTRLVEVIDDLLAAPPTPGSLRLVKPEAYYQFADPDLEALAAGQKALVRMGNENADRVKAKLREIRAALISQDQNPEPWDQNEDQNEDQGQEQNRPQG